ncbi:MAG TPA: glucose-6-phosphate dehydrogenase [Prolixibacteraceae bacterium]|nr:glucose-6-phosphate dehydrogenase [Prolixibacteraceae bacterium]
MKKADPHLLVIFGASGDLTRRKLIPALYDLYVKELLPAGFAVVGASRTPFSDEEFRENMRTFLPGTEKTDLFSKMLHYLPFDPEKEEDYHLLRKRLADLGQEKQTGGNLIFYLSTPPSLYGIIPARLHAAGLSRSDRGFRRLIVEKPFGTSLHSARELNVNLLHYFDEDQIFRIDHYLGKETVQNMLVTRFSNGIFEPLWNRNFIHHVEVTSAETLGVEGRGGYYDQSGALRDMIQNHLLQLTGFIAMEPPAVLGADAIRNETLKVFQALRPLREEETATMAIRGQYLSSLIRGEKIAGYREEKGVNPSSRTETYAALKFYIDNWRWAGVPFYLRTGKKLPARVTEAVVHFRHVPHHLFSGIPGYQPVSNQLVIRIQPDEGILLKMGMKEPGAGFHVKTVNMDFHYSDLAGITLPSAYERLLLDCMQGDATLFSRGDAVEEAWKFVQPILDAWENNPHIPVYGYPAGTWGPQAADDLMEEGPWRFPCKNLTDDGTYCEL